MNGETSGGREPRSAATGSGSENGGLAGAVVDFLVQHLPILLLLAVFVGSAAALRLDFQLTVPFGYYLLVAEISCALLLLKAAWHAWSWVPVTRPGKWAAAARAFRANHLSLRVVAGAAILTAVVPLFLDTFVGWKRAIPRFHAYTWDPALEAADRVAHFGHAPWAVLQPLLGYPAVTRALDAAYWGWYAVILVAVVCCAWWRDPRAQAQFFIAYLASWIILGTLAATLFASGGPCYFAQLTGLPDPYRPLFAYLRDAGGREGLFALHLQQELWDAMAARPVRGAGISAMPSLHVAMATLCARAAWKADWRLGLLLALFTLVIVLGSIHLGWHYAVDAYAAIPSALALWWGAGRFVGCYAARTGAYADASRSTDSSGPGSGAPGILT